jgi:hypothetical protein
MKSWLVVGLLVFIMLCNMGVGEDYSYDFETLGLDFSTPPGNPISIRETASMPVFVTFADGSSMWGFIFELTPP